MTAPPPTPPRRTRNRRGEGAQLRGEIVRAAAGLLEETGSEDAVTLRAVARGVGITAPSIYHHFADREAILLAVLADAFGAFLERLEAAVAGEDDPVARLRLAADAYVAFAAERPGQYRTMFGRHRAAAPDAPTAPLNTVVGGEAFGFLVDAIRACAGAGASASTDPFADATLLWAGLHGYAGLRAALPTFPWPEDGDAVLDALVTRLARLRG